MPEAAHLSELEPAGTQEPGEPLWLPVRNRFGIAAFGVNAWVAREAGDALIEDHDEDDQEELYFVASGRATFTLDGAAVDAPAGTFVHVPEPTTRRSAVGEEPGTTVVSIGAVPGRAFSVSDWERRWLGAAVR